jgi:carboxyl-terminal processing protease
MGKTPRHYLIVAALVAGFVLTDTRVHADDEKFYSDLIRLDKVVTKIRENYVEDVSSDELVSSAIDGMRGILDPHTSYFSPKDYEDLKATTEGEFGGIGLQVGVRDRTLTVISPIAGTPAQRMGLRAGDKIFRIDSISTQDISVDDAVDKLRGKPGTKVRLQVFREGVFQPLEFVLTREIIKIQSVPYAAMLNDTVGYVRVTEFAKHTGEDLEEKVDELKKKNPKGIILDLRVNPGGLLNQAVSVSELFLKKGDMVVYTQGRQKSQTQEYHSERDPIWTGKLVVLVDENSASAAEIVAGAMQDWDRGVVLGENTYGKGSVQTVLPLDGEGNTLKLTTAYYYTPAGRCINKPENAVRFKRDREAKDSSHTQDTTWFTTKAGRKVLAGGGITPDVLVPDPRYARFDEELLRKMMFFDFVVKKRAEITAKTPVTQDFQVTPELVEEFRRYVFADTTFSHFKSTAILALDDARAAWKQERREQDSTADTASGEFDRAATALRSLLQNDVNQEFAANRGFIEEQLKAELLEAVLGEDARTTFELQHDPQVDEAIHYINDNRLFQKVFKKTKDKG